jgi:hypothetical protein
MKILYPLRHILQVFIFILIAYQGFAKPYAFSRKEIQNELDPCAANVLRSYIISTPTFLCSDPNINGFMFSLEGQGFGPDYYVIKTTSKPPLLVEYNDGTFRLEIEVVMKSDVSKEYLIEIVGSAKTINNPQMGFTPATNYCANYDTTNWVFYNNFKITLTGKNGLDGQVIIFQSPQVNKHTFQIGKGANTWQASLGSGLWFDNANTQGGTATLKGDLQIALTPYECCKHGICVPFAISKND